MFSWSLGWKDDLFCFLWEALRRDDRLGPVMLSVRMRLWVGLALVLLVTF